jgi:5-methylcytosine-specific restriction endonuclease McrA
MERITITKKEQLQVFKRDNWTCKYCGDPVFFSPTLKLLENRSPGHGYYHQHGKGGEMLELFRTKWASVDHINPVTKGGQNELDNYATACWECNLTMNDTAVENKPSHNKTNQDNIESNWDGFLSLYPKLASENDSWVKSIKDIEQ